MMGNNLRKISLMDMLKMKSKYSEIYILRIGADGLVKDWGDRWVKCDHIHKALILQDNDHICKAFELTSIMSKTKYGPKRQ